ncbi:MAG TPA: TIGR02996 domain-containing protein [Kofleriaceae bacterium]|nr:TIGR02996 domain-containing protein [Kofleriaceae bacterium]
MTDLLAAVFEEPDDPGLRAVYADWLIERGDPRGELISIQLARETTQAMRRRETELLIEHGAAWAAPLGALFHPMTHVWDRGFFAGGALSATLGEVTATAGAPSWQVIRQLTDWHGVATSLLERPGALPILRALNTMQAAGARVARGGARPALAQLQVSIEYETISDPVLAACPALLGLRELAVHGRDLRAQAGWLPGAPILRQLARLALDAEQPFVQLAQELQEADSSLVELVLKAGSYWRVTLARASATDAFSDAVITRTTRSASRHLVDELCRTLRYVPPTVARLAIDPAPDALPRSPDLERALGAFAGTEVRIAGSVSAPSA